MKFEPKPHQIIAMDFLRSHPRCALFQDMGLGKTIETLTVAKELIDDFLIDKALVIAPKRVAEATWSSECEKWDHTKDLRVSKILGSAKQRQSALSAAADIYVINRENVQWLIEYLHGVWPFDLVIIDELSSFKSAQAKRFRMLRRVIKLSEYVWGLTGTPASNGYMDLWAEMFLIDGGEALGKTITSYRSKYFDVGAHKGHIVYEYRLKVGAKTNIDKKFQIEKVIPLLNSSVSSIEEMDSAIIGGTAAVVSGKLLQMANGAVYDDEGQVFELHEQKLDALAEIFDSAQGTPLLVFYSYKHDIDRIRKRFPGAVVLKDSADIDRWNNGEIQMLLCHPASAGYGLNLQAGSHIMVWFGLPWSLENYQQSIARLHRQGQGHPVICHHIICDGTIDDRVLRALQSKDATQKSLLDALKGYLTE